MPYIEVELEDSVNITVEEFFEEMDDEDIAEMKKLIGMETLRDENDFDREAMKLIGNSWRFTKEDEETILKIAAKIIC